MKPANLLRSEAQARAPKVSDLHIAVTLDLHDQPASYDVTDFGVSTTLTFTANDTDTFVDLHATEVSRVVINDTEVASPSDIYDNNRVALTGLIPGQTNTVYIENRCPYSRAGVGMHRFVNKETSEVYVYTQFEPFEAHRVFPCFDQPDIKAAFTFTVKAPSTWTVVSNAPVEDTTKTTNNAATTTDTTKTVDTTVWTFQETKTISTYLAAVVGGPFKKVSTTHRGIPMSLYCRGSLFKYLDHEEFFEITKQGLDWYKDAFGFDYPFEKYDQVFCPQFNFGAMENPGCVTFTERTIYRSKVTEAERAQRGNTILHEMAHMWFGDMVTMQWWDDLWLNESFATFIAHTALDEATRFGRASWSDFAGGLKAWAYQQDQLPSTHPIVADMVDTHSVMANFDGITYAKGSSVVKQLYSRVGREAFFKGIQNYMAEHAWGNTTLKDFLGHIEKTSGLSLDGWAKEWLQTTGVETFRLDFPVESAPGEPMQNVVLQKQADPNHPTVREHRLNIGLYYIVGEQLSLQDTVQVTVSGDQYVLTELNGKPRPDLALINDDDLTYAKVRLDEHSLATVEKYMAQIKDPVTRAVIWGSLWDGVRDAQVHVSEFVATVVNHVAREDDVALQGTLLRQTLKAIHTYTPEHKRDELLEQLSTCAMRELALSKDGSDQQLNWVRTRIDCRVDPEFSQGLLDGSIKVRGLEIEQDLRWRAIRALAEKGQITPEEINKEYESDPTEIGRQNHAPALAALPTKEAKEQAWKLAVDPETSKQSDMHLRRGVLRAMWQSHQEDLLAPWLDKWVDVLPEIWETSSAEEGLELTAAIYPQAIVTQTVVEQADKALTLGLPAGGNRRLAESRDATLRALKAQAFNR